MCTRVGKVILATRTAGTDAIVSRLGPRCTAVGEKLWAGKGRTHANRKPPSVGDVSNIILRTHTRTDYLYNRFTRARMRRDLLFSNALLIVIYARRPDETAMRYSRNARDFHVHIRHLALLGR